MQVEGTVDSWVEANVYQSLIEVNASLFVAAVIAFCVGYQSLIEVNARKTNEEVALEYPVQVSIPYRG